MKDGEYTLGMGWKEEVQLPTIQPALETKTLSFTKVISILKYPFKVSKLKSSLTKGGNGSVFIA